MWRFKKSTSNLLNINMKPAFTPATQILTFGATRATNNNAVLSASLWAHKAADVTGIGRQPRASETWIDWILFWALKKKVFN